MRFPAAVFVAASILITSVTALSWKYMGCYMGGNSTRLQWEEYQNITRMTQPKCIFFCYRKSYVYAALHRLNCYCGNKEPNSTELIEKEHCLYRCAGDKKKACGGIFGIMIYKREPDVTNRKTWQKPRPVVTTSTPATTTTPVLTAFSTTTIPAAVITTTIPTLPTIITIRSTITTNSTTITPVPTPTATVPALKITTTGYPANTIPSSPILCKHSKTTVNGKPVCRNIVVFEEHFDTLSPSRWSHVIKIPRSQDYRYVIFIPDRANSYSSNSTLVIKATELQHDKVKYGDLCLKNCTGSVSFHECGYKAQYFSILPPIQSARLTTKNSFSFRYGKVDIVAKLPLGDWLVPELWLEPKDEVYGPGYRSGRIQIAFSVGNKNLTLKGKQIGNNLLKCGVVVGDEHYSRTRRIVPITHEVLHLENHEGWHKDYHTYTVIWTPDNIAFEVDGKYRKELLPQPEIGLPLTYSLNLSEPLMTQSRISPFDQDFYITLGLSVGGEDSIFPDDSLNNGEPKPWRNGKIKSLLHFWQKRKSWLSSWENDSAALIIDSVKVTSL